MLNVVCQLSNVECRMSNVECQMLSIDYRMLSIGCRVSTIGCQVSNIGCRVSSIGCRVSDFEYRVSDVEYRMLSIEYRMSSIEYRMSSIEYRMSSIEYRMSSIEYQMSSIESKVENRKSVIKKSAMLHLISFLTEENQRQYGPIHQSNHLFQTLYSIDWCIIDLQDISISILIKKETVEAKPGRYYGLAKVHKPQHSWPQVAGGRCPPLRPVVSGSGTISEGILHWVDEHAKGEVKSSTHI